MQPRFLAAPPRYLFFTGKGGVGKTSLACATAVRLAESGRRVLLVSTDPASNVGQVFGLQIGNAVTAVPGVDGLSALEIDPQAAAQAYRQRIIGPVRGALPAAIVASIEEQLSGACTTEIAAFDEFTALLTDSTLTAGFAHVVFDTAPTGHTIRLLQLPGAWSGFLEAGKGDASCLGPLSGLEKQRTRYQAAVAALADPEQTRLVLVARAQHGALQEAARAHEELAALGLARQCLVINGRLPATEAAHDPLAAAICRREQAALEQLPPALRSLPRDELPLKGFNLVGVAALRQLLAPPDEPVAGEAAGHALPNLDAPGLASLVDDLALAARGLVMLVGKGGVGKTTLAAALAVALAKRGIEVHLTTSDPAAHLAQTLDSGMPNLTVSRIDPAAETARYREEVMRTRGAQLDAHGQALLAEDLRSPCTEEIAVFQAFSRAIAEAGDKMVVMDTAPSGHTLLLLDATGAYHREVTRRAENTAAAQATPLAQLQDPTRTRVIIVTLAETTPILEAAQLQADLRRAGIAPWAWVVNGCLAASHPQSRLLCQRAISEIAQLETLRTTHAKRLVVVPLQAIEPVGARNLLSLGGQAPG